MAAPRKRRPGPRTGRGVGNLPSSTGAKNASGKAITARGRAQSIAFGRGLGTNHRNAGHIFQQARGIVNAPRGTHSAATRKAARAVVRRHTGSR